MERHYPQCTGATRRSRLILCDVGAPTAWRRVWCVLQTTCWSLYVDYVESRGLVGAEAEPSWGGSASASLEATGTPKRIAKARREQLVFVRRFRGYRDPDMTLHAALSSEQGLGSTVQHGCQSWAQCRAQQPVTPASSCPGWHGVDVTRVSSATPLYRAVVRLT